MRKSEPLLIVMTATLIACGGEDVEDVDRTADSPRAKCPSYTALTAGTSLGLTAIYDKDGNELPDSDVNSLSVNWEVLDESDDHAFSGVGRYGNCTGALIEAGGTDAAPAYILTNGHCVGTSLLDPTGAIVDTAVTNTREMIFNYYRDVASSSYTIVEDTEYAFASMDKTDVAIVKLDSTIGALRDKGLCTYKLNEQVPDEGTTINVVGVAQSGVSRANLGVRLGLCTVGSTVNLYEGSYNFSTSFRHRCSIVGGNSGSPVFSARDLSIVGIVNTAVNDNAAKQADCSLNKPCEDVGGTRTVQSAENYGQQVAFLAGCFNTSGVFDRSLSTCTINSRFGL